MMHTTPKPIEIKPWACYLYHMVTLMIERIYHETDSNSRAVIFNVGGGDFEPTVGESSNCYVNFVGEAFFNGISIAFNLSACMDTKNIRLLPTRDDDPHTIIINGDRYRISFSDRKNAFGFPESFDYLKL